MFLAASGSLMTRAAGEPCVAATWPLTLKPWWSTTSAWTAQTESLKAMYALTDGRALTNAGDDLGQITVWGQVDDSDVMDVDLFQLTVWIEA